MKSIRKMDTFYVIGATQKTDVQLKVDLLVQNVNKKNIIKITAV